MDDRTGASFDADCDLPLFSRRVALQLGMAGSASIGSFWSQSTQAATNKTDRGKARAVILIFNAGAPSHIDLWDLKPDAPDNVRGIFKPIGTNVSGIHVSELLPRMAQRADKLAIVRSVHHDHSSHNAGMHWSIVGRPYRMDNTLINPSRSDYPSVGTLVGWLAQRDHYSPAAPPYVITPHPHCDSFQYITPGQFGGFLGAKYDPLVVKGDPNDKDFRVPDLRIADGLTQDRLQRRSELLSRLDDRRHAGLQQTAAEYDVNRAKALSLVTSADLSSAFDLSKEPDAVRERYGRNTWGQSHLLARRLVENGVKFVTTVNGPSIVWDTHVDNFNTLKNRLVPPMEQAYAALLDDLGERGLLDSTLVVWMGDFGRTPMINGKAGRDHWPQCYSMVLAGGGIRGGQVVGESDSTGAVPRSRAVTPADIHATMFKALGYDSHAVKYATADGRPTPLSEGDVIEELL
jgi:hypothetical protein